MVMEALRNTAPAAYINAQIAGGHATFQHRTGAARNTVPAVAFLNRGRLALLGWLALPGPRHRPHHPRGPGLSPYLSGFSATGSTSPPNRMANSRAFPGFAKQNTTRST
jgi:hypothetical protein